jgi:bifunctional non-homologous end joining protein LigD
LFRQDLPVKAQWDKAMHAKLRSEEEIREHNRHTANCRRCAIKEHHAFRHHYDFRLQYDGGLLSWVLLYGPSYRPGERRIAIRVDDHDCRYMTSERVIPRGMRGAGPVMLWDEGFWIALPGYEDIGNCLRNGCLKFMLECHKLHGAWILLRRYGGSYGQPNKNWDLIKAPDQFSRSKSALDIQVTAPYSVLTGRTLEGVEQDGNKKQVKRASMPLLFESNL